MLFFTYWFVLYVAILYPLYWFIPFRKARLTILLVGSAVFHTHFAGPAGVLPIVVLAMIVYLIGLSRNRAACTCGIILSASSLIYYKYTRFICQSVLGTILPGVVPTHTEDAGSIWSPIPPLAISFFAFEFIHYLVDVRGGAKPIRKIRDFALFSIFWPSIVAGPVKRYQQFRQSLHEGVRGVDSRDVAVGLIRLAMGMSKKFVADTLTAWLSFWGPRFNELDVLWKWFFVICLAFRILLDFSGYSDMAIGLARMHGIRLPENFMWPYLACSLTEFWHRWHCSLSSWIRDYIYIALGGGRCSVARKTLNGLLAFAICGLWHGAGWNFLVWGLYHGVGLAVCSTYRRVLGRLGEDVADRLQRNNVVGWLLTTLYVWIGWLFFFFPLPTAIKMIKSLLGPASWMALLK